MTFDQFDSNRRLPQSLVHIARLGLRNANAAGYAIDKLVEGGEAWLRQCAEGVPVPETDRDDLLVVCFPLGVEDSETGALSFVFPCKTISDQTRTMLTQVATAAQAIWRLWHAPGVYARSVIRIAELEAELADSKIADRACALLETHNLDSNPIDTISRSVDNILRAYQVGTVLDRLARELEHDAKEYELVRQAKAVLQTREGMSEEQAYRYLQDASRNSRRRLPDVAGDLIDHGSLRPPHRGATQERREVSRGKLKYRF